MRIGNLVGRRLAKTPIYSNIISPIGTSMQLQILENRGDKNRSPFLYQASLELATNLDSKTNSYLELIGGQANDAKGAVANAEKALIALKRYGLLPEGSDFWLDQEYSAQPEFRFEDNLDDYDFLVGRSATIETFSPGQAHYSPSIEKIFFDRDGVVVAIENPYSEEGCQDLTDLEPYDTNALLSIAADLNWVRGKARCDSYWYQKGALGDKPAKGAGFSAQRHRKPIETKVVELLRAAIER